MINPFRIIAFYTKIHLFVEYENFIINYALWMVIWLETYRCLYMIDLFVKKNWTICQKLSLSFFIATSTHKRTPCQRNSSFEYFLNFFYFCEKTVKMTAMTIHRKWSNFLNINVSVIQKMIWMAYLNSSNFSNQFRHFICQISFYDLKIWIIPY